MCGAVRYEASGDPISVIFCHCESCRRHTGAPVVALAGFEVSDVLPRYHEWEEADGLISRGPAARSTSS